MKNNAMLVTLDAISLFTHILHKDGLTSLKEKLDERYKPKVPTDYLVKLMDIILNQNIFTFHESLWVQEIGAAMGSPPVPGYADMFMDKFIDRAIEILGRNYNKANEEALQLIKRFLYDYFLIFNGTTKGLHRLLEETNLVHPTIKLT